MFCFSRPFGSQTAQKRVLSLLFKAPGLNGAPSSPSRPALMQHLWEASAAVPTRSQKAVPPHKKGKSGAAPGPAGSRPLALSSVLAGKMLGKDRSGEESRRAECPNYNTPPHTHPPNPHPPKKNPNPSFLTTRNSQVWCETKNNPIKTLHRDHKSCLFCSSARLFLPSFGLSQCHHPAPNRSLFS